MVELTPDQLCSRALLKIEQNPIASLDEPTPEGRAAAFVFHHVMKTALDFRWGFLKKNLPQPPYFQEAVISLLACELAAYFALGADRITALRFAALEAMRQAKIIDALTGDSNG